ncbi:DUF4097 family beta strand repeat-containing protein [Tellurirhabdus bombi]|uniref:DUF4097 family beta strand repeat-containing protein n=1 Tax=Tellurirhabdus bombi TaxID=2907205 RepID=UPI001F325C14|nr:DUF4097 family beta strand repeat-containing protein [Tellurirhabdus bombi]
MRRIAFLLATTLWCWGSYAQDSKNALEYKVKMPNSKDRKITIELGDGSIKIEGYDGDEVQFRASSGYEAPPERAKGLKPIYNSAVDNSGIGLAVTQESGGLKIEKATRKSIDYTIRVPRKVAILYQQVNWMGSTINISNMDGDLEVRTNNANINLNRVSGPVVANTTSGEIQVVFANLNQEKPSALTTIASAIDVTLPANAKTNLHLRTINGEMYTDFDLGLKSSKDGLSKVGGGHNIEGTTNGGGVDIQLKTISSNIYVRKQK